MNKTQGSSLSEVNQSVSVPSSKSFGRTLLAFLGPAYMVSVGYMDPGNWATDIAGGSRFGYSLVWVLLMSNLMALLLQSLAARLGVVKGWDLAQASRQQYPAWVNISLYAFAEIAIAACDLAEIIGMAIGLNLLFGLPLIYGVLITAFDTFILLLLLNKGIRKMEVFILGLISIIGLSFITEMFIVEPDMKQLAKGFIPSALDHESLYITIGIIGATVMPHNLYLHSSLVQTRKFARDVPGIRQALKFNFIDSAIALNLAFFVNAAILILAASAFFRNGLHDVTDINDAHLLLSNIFGTLAPALFAIALIAAGQSSTITGTLAGQIVMEGYLNLRISPWVRRLITRIIAMAPALVTILFFGEGNLGELLILSQVVLSLQLGFAVIPLIHFTSSKRLMGSFSIALWLKVLAWIAAIIIVSLNVKLVYEEIVSFMHWLGDSFIALKMLVLTIAAFAGGLLLYITIEPLIVRKRKVKDAIPHGEAIELNEIKAGTYNRIAVTVDFSKHDEQTIQHALSLGGLTAGYLLVHVNESAGAIRMKGEIEDMETTYDRENLKKYQDNLAKMGYKVEIKLGFGKSANVISNIINHDHADLLVMGAHGHRGIKDILLGATVDQVRHNVNVPVLIVK
jgi:manganese transport protein